MLFVNMCSLYINMTLHHIQCCSRVGSNDGFFVPGLEDGDFVDDDDDDNDDADDIVEDEM